MREPGGLRRNQCVATPDAPGLDAADPCVAAGGQIFFATDRDGDFEIARMWADGTGFQALTDNTWPDKEPRLSRNIDWVAYESYPSGTFEAWAMGADGGEPHPLLPAATAFSWSPMNDRLLLIHDDTFLQPKIYAVDPDGMNRTDLSQADNDFDSSPSWSPDGAHIAFETDRETGTTHGIYKMNADGTQIAYLRSQGLRPAWSPSGQWIAYDNAGLMRTPQNGSSEIPITADPVSAYRWSPDSSTLVYVNSADAADICTVRISDSHVDQLTATGNETEPQWSPDGTRIVFTSTRDGNEEIYVMTASGADQVNLTQSSGNDRNPQWLPCSP
jgi:Tol biopolymer transport system component